MIIGKQAEFCLKDSQREQSRMEPLAERSMGVDVRSWSRYWPHCIKAKVNLQQWFGFRKSERFNLNQL